MVLKLKKDKVFDTEKQVIEFSSQYYGGGQYILLENNRGLVDEHGEGDSIKVKIDEFKKQNFWKNIEELGVWKWHSKYPHKNQNMNL